GALREAQSQKPIPYASIRIEGKAYGSVSNAEGQFSLAFPAGILQEEAYLIVSCIGYKSQRLPLQSGRIEIEMQAQDYTLATVTIYSIELDARELVRQAFQNILHNYASEDYQWQSFYRHYCQEGETYGRLIEAVVELNNLQGHDRWYRGPDQKLNMRLKQLRRSFDFTRFSAFRHVPIAINRSLQGDIVSYHSPISQHLHSRKLRFQYVDTTFLDQKLVYVVGVRGRADGQEVEAQLYIQAADFAIIKADHRYTRRWGADSWRYKRVDHYVVDYQLFEGRYYLNFVQNEGQYVAQQRDEKGSVVYSEDHFHRVEMMTQTIRKGAFERFRGKEPNAAQMAKIGYEPQFWQQYSVLKASPLENRIADDLDHRMPLAQQFAGKTLPPQVQDRLTAQYFQQWLGKQRGRVVIVGFWDSSYDPGIKQILRARRLMRQFEDTPFSVLLISTDRKEEDWRDAIRKKRLYGLDHLRLGNGLNAPLCRDLGVEEVPYFVIYGPSGERLIQGAEVPSKTSVEQLLNRD
ncbi:MAG: carboxypeptidase-like regulatory domain-containing protein, partial [Bacteroidota bacterium]